MSTRTEKLDATEKLDRYHRDFELDHGHPQEAFFSVSIDDNNPDDIMVRISHVAKTAIDRSTGDREYEGNPSYADPSTAIRFAEHIIKVAKKVKQLRDQQPVKGA